MKKSQKAPSRSFRLIFELEPPRTPDLGRVRRQIELFGPIVDAILVPDNHLGLPAMSSLAIGLEIQRLGFRPMVGVNARDGNHVRLESNLITLAAYGIDEALFLYGDRTARGRSSLTVQQMLETAYNIEAANEFRIKKGVLATIGQPLRWRAKGDFLLTKLDFGRKAAGHWKEALAFTQPLYCGVIALPDAPMARKILNNIPDLKLPLGYLKGFESDPEYGFKAAIDELDELCRAGVDGAQLVVPANRRRFVEMLVEWKARRSIP